MSEHRARKRFGQNFLSDPNIIRKIIDAIRPVAGDTMVEIGPGLGAMTDPLIARLGHLHVVEIDRDLIARLKEHYSAEQLTIHEGDALKFDFGTLAAPLRVVGNLPYNISTPLLFHLAGFAERVTDMTFMLQKEVVMRMVADPGTEEYGRLSVMLQYRFRMGRLFDVPPGAFRPAPKVWSSVVRLIPTDRVRDAGAVRFERFVSAGFRQKRKTLANNLKNLEDRDWAGILAGYGIDPRVRAESLSLAEWLTVADAAC